MHVRITEILSRSEQGATLPFRCRGEDDELYFVKGNYAGCRARCCEWVAGRLAKLVGLPTPDIRIVEIPLELIAGSSRSDAAELGSGLAFASRLIEDAQEITLPDVENIPIHLQRLVLLFDWWVQNGDRTLTQYGGNPNMVWSNVAGGLQVFDLNLAFDESLDRAQFRQTHVFREAATCGWDLVFRAEGETKLLNALSKLDEIWQELPISWLYPGGDVSSPLLLDRRVVEAMLRRFQIEPDAFWRIER